MTTFRALQALKIFIPTRCRGLSKNQKYMPEVKFDETLKEEAIYKNFVEKKNLERAEIAKRILIRKRIIFTACWTLAISIYIYTIYRIKQETFLDDFEEPPRIQKQE